MRSPDDSDPERGRIALGVEILSLERSSKLDLISESISIFLACSVSMKGVESKSTDCHDSSLGSIFNSVKGKYDSFLSLTGLDSNLIDT